MNGSQLWKGTRWLDQDGPAAAGGPGRVLFTAFSERVEPQEIELGFTELPDEQRLGAIVARIRELLDAA